MGRGVAVARSTIRTSASRVVRALAAASRRVDLSLPSVIEIAPGVWAGRDVDGTHNVAFEGANAIGARTSFQGYEIGLGRGTTIGIGCVLNGPLSIGRYTQLGSYVGVYGVDHPVDVAVPNVNRHFLGGAVKDLAMSDAVRIGHGCWLGHGAVVLRGVTIGNGAVVGAGCIVAKDVPPYSTVVGVPAQVPRPRFDVELVAALERSEWWAWSDARLQANSELFLTSFRDDPHSAARLLSQAADREHPIRNEGSAIG